MQETFAAIGQHGNPRAVRELEESICRLGTEFVRAADILGKGGDLAALADRLRGLGSGKGEMGRALQLVAGLVTFRAAIEHWRGLAEQASRMNEREAKRQAAAAAVVTVEQFAHIMGTLGDILARNLDPQRFPGLLRAVNRDISNSLGGYIDAPMALGMANAC
jgi:hypothetical protein